MSVDYSRVRVADPRCVLQENALDNANERFVALEVDRQKVVSALKNERLRVKQVSQSNPILTIC